MIVDNCFLFVQHQQHETPVLIPDTKYGNELHASHTTTVTVYSMEEFDKCDRDVHKLSEEGTPMCSGKSYCSVRDQFSRKKGVLVAANKAMKDLPMRLTRRDGEGYRIVNR